MLLISCEKGDGTEDKQTIRGLDERMTQRNAMRLVASETVGFHQCNGSFQWRTEGHVPRKCSLWYAIIDVISTQHQSVSHATARNICWWQFACI